MARKFYGTGDAKGFSRKTFYETIVAYLSGEEVAEGLLELVFAAAKYELDGIALAKDKKGENSDVKPLLEKDVAIEVMNSLVPLLGDEPLTSIELCEMANAKGLTKLNGQPFKNNPWINQVLKKLAEDGEITMTPKKVTGSKIKDGVPCASEDVKIAYTK